MVIQIIVAADEKNAIGKDNQLPWHLPNDLRFFKEKTLGHPIIMGRKTFESIGKPLPGRINVVLSRTRQPAVKDVVCSQDLEHALQQQKEAGATLVSIIGGGEIFKQGLHFADKIWFTRVHTVIKDATVFFPNIDPDLWKRTLQVAHFKDEAHRYDYTFEEWVRRIVL